MLTPFNGHKYVIREVKASEIKKLLKLAEHLNLKITYPKMFGVDKDLYRIHISDNHLGGYVSSMIAKYDDYQYFPNFNELRLHVIRMSMRKEYPFIIYSYEDYSKYLDTLSIEKIKQEGDIVGGIISLVSEYYDSYKEYIPHVWIEELQREKKSIETINECLSPIKGVIDCLEEVFDVDIYLSYPNKNKLKLYDKEKLLEAHIFFHHPDGIYNQLKILMNNLNIIYLIFDYHLHHKISYLHSRFDLIRSLGYEKDIPKYLVGNNIESIYKRFFLALSSVNEIRYIHIFQYHFSYRNREDVNELIKRLEKLGYRNHFIEEGGVHAICIDNKKKDIRNTTVTSIAGYCSWSGKPPLDVSTVLKHFDSLFVHPDIFLFYSLLVKRGH